MDVATDAALGAALRLCRLAVAAVFRIVIQQDMFEWTLKTLQNTKPEGSKTIWGLLLHWVCIHFYFSKSFS